LLLQQIEIEATQQFLIAELVSESWYGDECKAAHQHHGRGDDPECVQLWWQCYQFD
jgi:hypothetical protein